MIIQKRPFSLFVCVAVIFFTGCGMVGEKELAAPKTKIESPLGGCSFPELKSLIDQKRVTEALVDQAIGCAEDRIRQAFEKLQGQRPGELSLGELKTLQQKKWVELPLDHDSDWEILSVVLEFFHPEGKPAISKKTADFLFSWLRKEKKHYVERMTRPREKKAWDSEDWQISYDAAASLIEVISNEFTLSLERAWKLSSAIETSVKTHGGRGLEWSLGDRNELLEALWILKSIVLPDGGHGVRAELKGKTIKGLIRFGLNLFREGKLTAEWIANYGTPDTVPEAMPQEWGRLSAIVRNYFTADHFAYIDADLLAWSLRKIEGQQSLADFAPDLVRVSQRIAPESVREPGFHVSGFLPIADEAESLAKEIQLAAKKYVRVEDRRFELSYREALKDPVLKMVALKGPMSSWYNSNEERPKKQLDETLRWSDVIGRLAKRKAIAKVFEAFDGEPKDGKIPFKGEDAEDLKEPIDLAYAFLRFVAAGAAATERDEKKRKEIQIPNQVMVKPGSLSRVMGLIGDEWMPDGDRDGALSADEFFSVVQVYEDIQYRASSATWSMNPSPTGFVEVRKYRPENWSSNYRNEVFKRKEYIAGMSSSFRTSSYVMSKALEAMGELRRSSLFHSLFPINYRAKTFEAVKSSSFSQPTREMLTFVVKRDDMIAPAAIVTVMDRLLIRCDKNENGVFEWDELKCATPLILEAGYQTVGSTLIDLDPGVNDASRFLLSFLKLKGLPSYLARLALANGSLKEFQLEKEFESAKKEAESKLEANWERIAKFIGAPETPKTLAFWILEAKKRYGHCDKDTNGSIAGEKEWDCFVDEVIRSLELTTKELMEQTGNQAGTVTFEELKQSPVLKFAIRLGTQGEDEIDALLTRAGMRSSPAKILCLLEEIIRRSVSLWELPD